MTEQAYDYSRFKDEESSNALAVLSDLAHEQRAAEEEVARCESALKAAQERLKDISENRFPTAMDEIGMGTFKTKDGIEVAVKNVINASIPKDEEKAEQCFRWLEDDGNGGLIKREIKIEFNRDEESWAKKFLRDLSQRKKPVRAKLKKFVEPMTLKSFVSKKMEAGVEVPKTCFSIHKYRKTVIDIKG